MAENNAHESKVIAQFFKRTGRPVSYKKGRRLPSGDVDGKVLYVRSGFAAAYTVGRAVPVHAYYAYGPNDLIQFGQLTSGQEARFVYITLTGLSVYVVSQEQIWQAAGQDPALSIALLHEVIRQNKLHARRIENLSYRYASDKLIYRILNLAERFGCWQHDAIQVGIPVTHRAIGMFVNMARESVSREMEKLIKKGLINYERQRITILDPHRLIASLHEPVRTNWHEVVRLIKSDLPTSPED